MLDTPTTDPLLADIEIVLDLYNISATAFSYYAAGDPALVKRLRDGMVMREPRRTRVKRALERIQQHGGLPE